MTIHQRRWYSSPTWDSNETSYNKTDDRHLSANDTQDVYVPFHLKYP